MHKAQDVFPNAVQSRYNTMTGIEVRKRDGEIIGHLDSVIFEDNIPWGNIDGNFEVDLRGSEEIIDLVNNKKYLRLSTPLVY